MGSNTTDTRRHLTQTMLGCISLAGLLMGCDKISNVANRGHLQRDMTALAQQVGVTLTAPECHMVGMTRDGVCTFKTSSGHMAQLVQGLKLQAEPTNALLDAQCGSQDAFHHAPRLYRYSVRGRPPALRLKNSSAFQSLSILYNAAGQSACAVLSYSYG